jgi:type I restriction enzyme R subunit
MMQFAESHVEQAALAWVESLGWTVKHGSDIAPDTPTAGRTDYGQVVLEQRLRDVLARLNPTLPAEALEDAFRKLSRPEGATLEARNRAIHRLLVDGVTVEYRTADVAIRGAQARVVDFHNADNNDWLAVNQFTVSEHKHIRRPDVMLFINGLPLVLIELKNAADEDASSWSAYQQLQTYQAELPTLFAFNALLAVSDGVEARLGTLTAGREWFKPWRTVSGETLADPHLPELQVMLEGVFDKRRLLDLVRHFMVFEDAGGGAMAKKMAAYHQFHAVNVAVAETLWAAKLQEADRVAEGRGGYEAGQPRREGRPAPRAVGAAQRRRHRRRGAP